MGIPNDSAEVLEAELVVEPVTLSDSERLDKIEGVLESMAQSLNWLVNTVQMIATVAQTMSKGGGFASILGMVKNGDE